MRRQREIEQEIRDLHRELEQLGDLERLTTDKGEITNPCKIREFDVLHSMAVQEARSIIEDGRCAKDMDHYIYEAVMIAALGANVWDVLNEYL